VNVPLARLDDATIERARSAQSLVGLVARRVQLRRSGRSWSGLCPFHKEKTPSFTVSDERGFYHCFGCGAHGSAIDWMMNAEGLTFREAVSSLLGGALPDARRPLPVTQREIERPERHDYVSSATAGRWIWNTSWPAKGESAEAYLAWRGLDPGFEPLPGFPAIDQVRSHARCPLSLWRVDRHPEDGPTAPALIVPIRDAEGAIWGVRVTWIDHHGQGEAKLPRLHDGRERPKRKIFGKLGGCAAWLSSPEAACSDGPLIVGEGFETTWAFAQGLGRPCRPVATLSLENLQGQAVRLRDGSLPLWNVQADPQRPPFTLPDAGEAIIAVDADMKPLKDQKVQVSRGARPERRDLSGLERAEICAALAAQAWRRAGATSVRCVRPRMGMDFNDQVRRNAA
jgi:hypothetical protein